MCQFFSYFALDLVYRDVSYSLAWLKWIENRFSFISISIRVDRKSVVQDQHQQKLNLHTFARLSAGIHVQCEMWICIRFCHIFFYMCLCVCRMLIVEWNTFSTNIHLSSSANGIHFMYKSGALFQIPNKINDFLRLSCTIRNSFLPQNKLCRFGLRTFLFPPSFLSAINISTVWMCSCVRLLVWYVCLVHEIYVNICHSLFHFIYSWKPCECQCVLFHICFVIIL